MKNIEMDDIKTVDAFLEERGVEFSQSLFLSLQLSTLILDILDSKDESEGASRTRTSELLRVLERHNISFDHEGRNLRISFSDPLSFIRTHLFQVSEHDGIRDFELPHNALPEYLYGLFHYLEAGNAWKEMYLHGCLDICSLYGAETGREILLSHWIDHLPPTYSDVEIQIGIYWNLLTKEEVCIAILFVFLADMLEIHTSDNVKLIELYMNIYNIFDPTWNIRSTLGDLWAGPYDDEIPLIPQWDVNPVLH